MANIKDNMYIFGSRARSKLLREFMSFFNLRPSSYPYITGDGFRKMADHIYDETGKCRSSDVKEGQIVFVKGDMIHEWFRDVHPKISSRYKLITHNSDYNVGESDLSFINDKIICWFAQNVIADHPKLVPIPIGINNYCLYMQSAPSFYDKFRTIKIEQRNRIIFGFSIGTNPKERQLAYDFLVKSGISDKIKGKNYPKTYIELIKKYKFIAAPNGNGLDDPRRWQALYLGIIPIVTKSVAMDYFKRLGLPIYIISDWNELTNFKEEDMNRIYNELIATRNDGPLFFDYWKKLIINYE